MFAPKKYFSTDGFSAYADNALRQAIDIAKQNKAKIYLLHVIDDGFQQCAVDYCLNEGDVQKILKDSIKNAKDRITAGSQESYMTTNSSIEIVYDARRGNFLRRDTQRDRKKKASI